MNKYHQTSGKDKLHILRRNGIAVNYDNSYDIEDIIGGSIDSMMLVVVIG